MSSVYLAVCVTLSRQLIAVQCLNCGGCWWLSFLVFLAFSFTDSTWVSFEELLLSCHL